MCGRFLLEADIETLLRYYHLAQHVASDIEKTMYYPSEKALVMIRDKKAGFMPWGIKREHQSKLLINARSETVHEKSLFRDAFLKGRCLIPATAFIEWNRQKQAYMYRGENQEIMSLAGIYLKCGQADWRFAILTKQAQGLAKDIHHRVPVVLPAHAIEDWLSPVTNIQQLRLLLTHALDQFQIDRCV